MKWYPNLCWGSPSKQLTFLVWSKFPHYIGQGGGGGGLMWFGETDMVWEN